MNIILNLSKINSLRMMNYYLLEEDGLKLIDKQLEQVVVDSDSKLIVLVKPEYIKVAEQLFSNSKLAITILALDTSRKVKLATDLILDDVVLAYKTFKTNNLSSVFEFDFNFTAGTVLIDGSKLYKKNYFNFSNIKSDVYIKFEDKARNYSTSYILYISPQNSIGNTEIRKVIVSDYINNFIDFTDLETIINSNQQFSVNKQLMLELIEQHFITNQFDKGLLHLKSLATKSSSWMFYYLEMLINFGHEQQLLDYYKNNRVSIEKNSLTIAQTQQYKDVYEVFKLIDSEQRLVNQALKEYFTEENIQVEFIVKQILSSKVPVLNLSYFINRLYERKRITETEIVELLNLLEKVSMSPYVNMRNVIQLAELTFESASNISYKVINQLIVKLETTDELCYDQNSKLLELLASSLRIETNQESINDEKAYISNSNKVAVCITGIASYNYQKNLELIYQFTSKYLDAEYFVQMWDEYYTYPGLASKYDDSDFKWAENNLARIRNSLPKIIERKANFEALLPETSKLLFTEQSEKVMKKNYSDQFSDKLVAIKKFELSSFNRKLENITNWNHKVADKLRTQFEKATVGKMIEMHCKETGIDYDYVICIDIKTLLKSYVKLDQLQNIDENQIAVLTAQGNTIGNAFTAATYSTFLKYSELWSLTQLDKSISPYSHNSRKIVDKDYDPMLSHLLYNNIRFVSAENTLGCPYISKKIKLPVTNEAVSRDLANYEGDSSSLRAYFEQSDKLFTSEIINNQNYTKIEKVKLADYEITNEGIELIIELLGHNLEKIKLANIYLYGISKQGIDSDLARPKLYKQQVNVLKSESNQIIIQKIVSNDELLVGREWQLKILYHDFTLTHFDIDVTGDDITKYELNKHGLKYISNTSSLNIGLKTKSFFLSDCLVN